MRVMWVLALVLPLAARADDFFMLNLWGTPGGEAIAVTAGPLSPEQCEHARQGMQDFPQIPPTMPLQVSMCVPKQQIPARLSVPWHCVAQQDVTDPRERGPARVWLYSCVSVY